MNFTKTRLPLKWAGGHSLWRETFCACIDPVNFVHPILDYISVLESGGILPMRVLQQCPCCFLPCHSRAGVTGERVLGYGNHDFASHDLPRKLERSRGGAVERGERLRQSSLHAFFSPIVTHRCVSSLVVSHDSCRNLDYWQPLTRSWRSWRWITRPRSMN